MLVMTGSLPKWNNEVLIRIAGNSILLSGDCVMERIDRIEREIQSGNSSVAPARLDSRSDPDSSWRAAL